MNSRLAGLAVALLIVGLAAFNNSSFLPGRAASGSSPKSERDTVRKEHRGKVEYATFGAGCFWGVEASFRDLDGVVDAEVGYSGGSTKNPTYKQVCSDRTGHAEVVRVQYDPERVTYRALVKAFFDMHDPTTPNRQGPDIGSQYRSVIFYHTEEQRNVAEDSKRELDESKKLRRPVVTQVVPATEFWRAEEYHQRYLEKRGLANCHL